MNKIFIRQNIHYLSIILYFIIFSILVTSKPAIIFNEDGSIKQFGIGYQNKSVIPMWLTVILVSIFSYLIILYLITYSHKIF